MKSHQFFSVFAAEQKQPTVLTGILMAAASLIPAVETPAQTQETAKTETRPLVFVITGESNSGGTGANSDATPEERAPRPNVQIMNLTDGRFGFEDMQLGVNNLRDHHRLEKYYDVYHGLELGLANAADGGKFPDRKPVYLIKTGHGGSRIAQWTEGNDSGFWKKFVERIDAAKRQLPENPQWVVWFSLGINDAIDTAPIEPWTNAVRAHLVKIRKQLPGAVIVMTQFQSMKAYPETDAALAEIANEDSGVAVVDSSGTTLRDKNHWDYAGLKAMASRMVEATQSLLEAETKPTENAGFREPE